MGNKWRACRLGDVFGINPARPLKRGSITPFIPMEALPPHARAVERIASREYTGSGMRFRNGDTLIARITPCLENGKTAFVSGLQDGEVAHGSTEYIVLAGKDGQSDSLFGYYLARTPEFRRYAIGHMEGTSGRQRVPATAIEKYHIALPPLAEQRAIAQILGALDDKIELGRRMNQTLENMAQALFQSWFVDFDGVSEKDMQKSELGLIPKGWRVAPLDSIANYLNGLALQKFPAESETDFLPVIKIAQLRSGNTNGADKASTQIKPEYIVEDGDVLFSWSGSLEVEIWTGGRGALNQHLFKVTSREFPKWFYYFATRLHLPEFRAIAAGKATTMGHIQRRHLADAKIVVPTADAMDEFDSIISPLFQQQIQTALQSRTLAALRDTLLPKLLSGKIRVDSIRETIYD